MGYCTKNKDNKKKFPTADVFFWSIYNLNDTAYKDNAKIPSRIKLTHL